MHIYLRLAQMWGWFFVCRYACGGDNYFPAAVNTTCQVIVYIYYMMSLVRPQGMTMVRKARTTEVQVLQFVICALHAIYVLIVANTPRPIASLQLVVMVSALLLYADYDATIQRPKAKKRRASDAKESQRRLTFCFDCCGWLYCYHFGVAKYLRDHVLPKDMDANNAPTKFPDGIAFSGSSGGALVAACLATGIDPRSLFDYVMEVVLPRCQYRPDRIAAACRQAIDDNVPTNSTASMEKRCRVLLTRVSLRPPFITGEVAQHWQDHDEVKATLRASCNVPGLNGINILPLRIWRGGSWRYYYDGLMWSSLFVPWQCEGDSHVVKISAVGLPLQDIRASWHPLFWAAFPPSNDACRGMFWTGYQDAERWFREGPGSFDCCACRAGGARRSPDEALRDALRDERLQKYVAARKLLRTPPEEQTVPQWDPLTGQEIRHYLECYHKALERAWSLSIRMVFCVAVLVLGGILAFAW